MSRPSQQSNSDAFRRDAPCEYIIPYKTKNTAFLHIVVGRLFMQTRRTARKNNSNRPKLKKLFKGDSR